MAHLVIEGGRKLSGSIAVEGNKNAALPILAACVLTPETCEIRNVPRIRDVAVMIDLLRSLGAEVEGDGTTTLRVTCRDITVVEAGRRAGRQAARVSAAAGRAARTGRAVRRSRRQGATFRRARTITTHLLALAALGARVVDDASGHRVEAAAGGLTGASMYLVEASVTGTETALLAAAQARGATEIRHAACEPHVGELCQFLQGLGVGITGAGTSSLRIEPPAQLRGTVHTLRGDYIEAGSWAVVGAVTGGEVEVTGAAAQDLEPIAAILNMMGVSMELDRRPAGRAALQPRRRAPHRHGPVARVSQRHREPGDRARHAGARPDAAARLDVRTAPVRARAAELDAGRISSCAIRTASS